MEIIIFFMHAYILMFLYEIFTSEKHYIIKWIVILLIGIAKYIAECFTYTKHLTPFIMCTLLVIYSICIHSQNTNLENFKLAFFAYGIDYVINLALSSV